MKIAALGRTSSKKIHAIESVVAELNAANNNLLAYVTTIADSRGHFDLDAKACQLMSDRDAAQAKLDKIQSISEGSFKHVYHRGQQWIGGR
ncbi:hypothetical protein TPL01_11260 [Sulfuriferula plumbiphila]|uniref:Uncharacterized protein n=1 Tax=Sulfuriferula plumbiphila TaxID=171865 RepID=A0A512L682_9PROT|nr:hypothetical protein [Sulfuriferula plumbiphila]BBP03587.1 hypothetical protein SFPGR_10090 [Sulfuriferula plumbiphila]GEP29988.1 hypothetical protein TPL01_11260 [Sulfuriferula plumbiphila]